jgi:hypothetical protein
MKKVILLVLLIPVIFSCTPKNFLTSKGLNFTMDDWRKYYEQPYVVNTLIGCDLYLPVTLFGESEIGMVYFKDMKSDVVRFSDDQKSQIVIEFIDSLHTMEKPPYTLYKNHAVVNIKSSRGKNIYMKLKDIRIPSS